MILQLYAIRDTKVEAYSQPYFFRSQGEAIRSFTDTVNDRSTLFNRHPNDYAFFHLGTFDDQSASFDLFPAPLHVGLAVDFITPNSGNVVSLPKSA